MSERGDLDAFYAAVYPRLVGQLILLTGSKADAEEIAQDAVVRLLPNWNRISRYDDPEAWLRRVAVRLAVSRWRRSKVATAALVRLRDPGVTPGPDGTDIDLTRALATLPLAQRQVLVLHHVAGQPVEHIARDFGIAVGTVKSRLARGRAALAPHLALSLERPDDNTEVVP